MHTIKIGYGQAIFKAVTFGVVNLTKYGVVFKDPITGISDILKSGMDCLRDFNEGVWTGTRGLNEGNIGLSSGVLRLFNADMIHQAVRINGISYSITNQKQDQIQVKEISQNETETYDWKYRGKSKVSDSEMKSIIKDVNNYSVSYNLLLANCQDVSDSLSKYAMGLYDKYFCLYIIFPKMDSLSDAIFQGIATSGQVKTVIRLYNDIVAKLFK
ncbi:hypothetical protein TTHERM_00094270 (macronuclear) [Tetrahymena thermophila SB210]|uniref:Uncharacterized protein n=1 Tax=Tetrahymena thermophila (strain SB210) TaxID=312017 RepID=Q235W4_TETTS|nr:hypothetical protein TTHERM_00094270 [Tetrahymena thermophila SB210]EAR92636.1 hypothetical protein TTHERM_00094270 [Tetrahymena thermophila SB210]|eukprot:XP_001012881.1 hypothetical protein TTHERM_00094270 [Tetrahymena thermophila SB210]